MVVGHDHLGHGASVKDETEWGYFAENPSDTLLLICIACEQQFREKSGDTVFYDGTQHGFLYAAKISVSAW